MNGSTLQRYGPGKTHQSTSLLPISPHLTKPKSPHQLDLVPRHPVQSNPVERRNCPEPSSLSLSHPGASPEGLPTSLRVPRPERAVLSPHPPSHLRSSYRQRPAPRGGSILGTHIGIPTRWGSTFHPNTLQLTKPYPLGFVKLPVLGARGSSVTHRLPTLRLSTLYPFSLRGVSDADASRPTVTEGSSATWVGLSSLLEWSTLQRYGPPRKITLHTLSYCCNLHRTMRTRDANWNHTPCCLIMQRTNVNAPPLGGLRHTQARLSKPPPPRRRGAVKRCETEPFRSRRCAQRGHRARRDSSPDSVPGHDTSRGVDGTLHRMEVYIYSDHGL